MDEDLNIIEMRRKKLDEENKSIYDGVSIHGRLMFFSEKELFKGLMKIMLPDDFVDMPAGIAKIKYPSADRPQIIKTDLTGSINFTFSMLNASVEEAKLEAAVKGVKQMIKNLQPMNRFYDELTERTQSGLVSMFDYKSHAVDTQIYNIVYMTLIRGKIMHGSFNCDIKEKDNWHDTALQVIKSIRQVTDKE